jgi:hypothetical protein
VAATGGGRPGRPDSMALGLLSDPDLPVELAEQLAGELPELLAERLDNRVAWQVQVLSERFDLGDEERLLELAAQRRAREGWDLVVCLTDLPRRSGLRPIVAEASVSDGVALASLPALGARQLYERARALVRSWQWNRWSRAGPARTLVPDPACGSPGPSDGSCRPMPASMCGFCSPESVARPGCWPAWSAPTAPGG